MILKVIAVLYRVSNRNTRELSWFIFVNEHNNYFFIEFVALHFFFFLFWKEQKISCQKRVLMSFSTSYVSFNHSSRHKMVMKGGKLKLICLMRIFLFEKFLITTFSFNSK